MLTRFQDSVNTILFRPGRWCCDKVEQFCLHEEDLMKRPLFLIILLFVVACTPTIAPEQSAPGRAEDGAEEDRPGHYTIESLDA